MTPPELQPVSCGGVWVMCQTWPRDLGGPLVSGLSPGASGRDHSQLAARALTTTCATSTFLYPMLDEELAIRGRPPVLDRHGRPQGGSQPPALSPSPSPTACHLHRSSNSLGAHP